MSMFMMMISMILMIIMVLVGVAFLTLLERKVLGYIQIRKGPNKIGLSGILQPFSDAVKLFSKEQVYLNMSNYFMYYFSPVMGLFMALVIWMLVPNLYGGLGFNLGMLYFMCCLSVGVYLVMFSGWSSNSNYAMLGGLRAVAQTISYEVSLALILMSLMLMIEGFNLFKFSIFQENIWFMWVVFPLSLIFFVSCLAETNRTPFDFAEGESELVSGFNIEYSSGGFALIFLAEYASILFMSFIFSLVFLGGNFFSIIYIFKVVLISFLFIWVRGTMPRYRYDKLMYLAWKSYLPLSLNYMLIIISLKILMFY
uniref:NADH dehydrogenase subunit 1 n=1 Tax=Frontopsylla spadix TaxID=360618 RepID=UPI0024110F13|nr:NADH dehydrogenase subunit 1 [Frontopsylla spadix]YP_011004275.1 NADH dehydrogenase subunit 1 [Frontopsylla diqingensis]WEQ92376.1 NADH dehydrogenase subunit 1 [Frontopsylla spadix]WPS93650.1 NADH dehydrogenase subunit 1 [Frontopsylla diqingensis]